MASHKGQTFTLLPEHITLLRASYVDWEAEPYYGSACVGVKRPYGNSYVPGDVARLLGVKIPEDDDHWDEGPEYARLMRLHQETATALQIVLATGSFEPGTFVIARDYDQRSWTRCPEAP